MVLGNIPFAEYLLSKGADPNLTYGNNKSPKQMAMETKNLNMQALFLGEGDLFTLPDEIMYRIFTFLHPKELAGLRLCSKKYKGIIDRILNDHGYMDRYGSLYEDYIIHTAAVNSLSETLRTASLDMKDWLKSVQQKDSVNFMGVDPQSNAFAEYKIQISVVGPTGYGKTTLISTIRDGVYPAKAVPDRTHCVNILIIKNNNI